MSGIIYIVEEIQKRKKKESIIDALESIGLSSEDISNIDDPERILKEYQKSSARFCHKCLLHAWKPVLSTAFCS